MTDWVDPDAMMAYLYGEDPYGDINAPTFDQSMIGNLYGVTPQYDFEGDPISPSTQSSIWNRWRTSLYDPMFAGNAGGQAFAAGTFDPTISYEMIDNPALTALNMYRRNPQGSIEGMVLEELENGGTPATAFSHLRTLAAQESELGEMVRAQLLPATDNGGMVLEGEYDWGDVMQKIAGVQQQMMEAPQVGPVGAVFDPETGNVIQQGGENVIMEDANGNPVMVRQVTTPSPLGEKYAEMGLSPPTQQYQASDFYTPEMEQAMAQYAALGPTVDAAREAYLHPPADLPREREDARVIYQQMLEQQQQAATPEQGGGGGGLRSILGFNVPEFGGAGDASTLMPPRAGGMGAIDSVTSLGQTVPWAVNTTANQVIPGGPGAITPGATGAVLSSPAASQLGQIGSNPSSGLAGATQWFWNQVFPGDDEEPAPETTAQSGGTQGQVGNAIRYEQMPIMDALLGLKTNETTLGKLAGYPTERPGSEEGPPPGTTVPEQPTGPAALTGDALTAWMTDLVSSGSTREGAISYATANGVDPAAAARAYDMIASTASRQAPPSASEIPDYTQPPLPGATSPPGSEGAPWAPQTTPTSAPQSDAAASAWDMLPWYQRQGLPVAGSPGVPPGYASPAIAQSLYDYQAATAPPGSEGAPWAPPTENWLGINWGGQQQPAPPGPLPEPRDERTQLQPSTHFNVQLPPGSVTPPPQPGPLTGMEPDEVSPGHYIVQLTNQAVQDAARRSQTRPMRDPDAPLGTDPESMLRFMLQQSQTQQPAAAPQVGAPPQSERATAPQGGQPQQPQQPQQRRRRLWEQPSEERQQAAAQFRDIYMQRFNTMQQAYGADWGHALGMARAAQDAGVTPYQQQIMARRMAIMASGMPTGNYLPGT